MPHVPCPYCEMTGWIILRTCKKCQNRAPYRRNCTNCGGSGQQKAYPVECYPCDGTGKLPESHDHPLLSPHFYRQ